MILHFLLLFAKGVLEGILLTMVAFGMLAALVRLGLRDR